MEDAAAAHDQPVGSVHVYIAGETVSVASHIVDGGRTVPTQYLVVAAIESGHVSVHMVPVVDIAAVNACLHFGPHKHDILAYYDTSFYQNEVG